METNSYTNVLVDKERLHLLEHLRSSPRFSGVHTAQSLMFSVVCTFVCLVIFLMLIELLAYTYHFYTFKLFLYIFYRFISKNSGNSTYKNISFDKEETLSYHKLFMSSMNIPINKETDDYVILDTKTSQESISPVLLLSITMTKNVCNQRGTTGIL
jgi:hypothetical protein